MNAANSMQNGTTVKLSQMPSNFVRRRRTSRGPARGPQGRRSKSGSCRARPCRSSLVDSTPGPFPLPGNLGTLNLGSAVRACGPVVDGIGLFGLADPNGQGPTACAAPDDILAVVPPGL
jgi:hypothetical protein